MTVFCLDTSEEICKDYCKESSEDEDLYQRCSKLCQHNQELEVLTD